MLELLKGMLTGQNAFASGGLLLMIIGGSGRARPRSCHSKSSARRGFSH
jgi:hypothetical protein